MARIITVTSGKGGVGKTNICLNLALYLAALGHRVCLFDADLGLANINVLIGVYPEYGLEDVILGKKTIDDILIRNFRGIDIIPGSSGVEKLADLPTAEIDRMMKLLPAWNDYDFIFFDTSAGISRSVVSFCMASPEVLLILTPEPTSLTDGYALLKILSLNDFKGSVRIIINQGVNIQKAAIVFDKFKTAVQKFLPVRISPAGTVVHDLCVVEAVKKQQPFILSYPSSAASKCIKNIARYLTQMDGCFKADNTRDSFWHKFFTKLQSPLQLNHGKSSGAVKSIQQANPSQNEADRPFPFEPSKKTDNTTELYPLLNSLVTHLASMSRDIGAIRRAIENNEIRSEKQVN